MAIHSQYTARKKVNPDSSTTVVWFIDWAQEKLSAEEYAEFLVAKTNTDNLIISLKANNSLMTKPLVPEDTDGVETSTTPAGVRGIDMYWTIDPNSVQWDENWIKYRTRYESDPDLID